jgi:penicillin-binding protein 1A
VLAWGNSAAGSAVVRQRAARALRGRVGPVEIGEAGLDPLLRARLSTVVLPGKDGAAPLLRADRVVVRPRLLSLLAGRVEPAAVALRGVTLRPSAEGPEIGPIDLYVDLPGNDAARVHAVLPGEGSLDADVRRGPEGLAFSVRGTLSLPEGLPAGAARALPFVPSGRLLLQATGRASPDGRSAGGEVALRAVDLTFSGERTGPVPLGPFAAAISGRLTWTAAGRHLRLAGGRLTLGDAGEAGADVEGEVSLRDDRPFSISARAGAVPWSTLVDALPVDLSPPPTAPRVVGTLSARASVAGSLARRGEWDVQVDLDLEDLRRGARAAGPTWLSSGFEWTPIDTPPGEPRRRIPVGPGNPAFVPYAEIPQVLVRAVTASEDAGFFGHRGFDFREIASAVNEPDRVRGASTISQQLAKNLFLSPERTLARKVREALATIALEASLPKWRLMEIYLNIAEWGPGVYGIGEAARFWFGKDARELTPREAAFLATVIPSPRRFHARLHRAGLTPWWNARIDDVLGKMRVQNQLTDEQLAAALAETLAPLGRQHPAGEPTDGADQPAPEGTGPDGPDAPVDPYLSREVMRPRVRSYGLSSSFTRSPGMMRMWNFFILPEA